MRVLSRIVFLAFLAPLLLAACVQDDPRYPVYYSYRVDVKVDGVPVTIQRVIKCTGTLVSGSTVAPSVTSGGTYRNPPLMGAYVNDTGEAVYTPVVHACRWASSTAEEREEDAKKLRRSLDRPFTDQHDSLPPDSILPVLWVNDDQTLDQMEYYVSERTLSGVDSHVEFVKAHPPEIADEQAFRASEVRAATESPDLTPFIYPRDQGAARELKLYKERGHAPGKRVRAQCHAAWHIPRDEWSKVPGMEAWTASLPAKGVGYRLPVELLPPYHDTVRGPSHDVRLMPVSPVSDYKRKVSGRFATVDQIHPVIPTDEGAYVDLSRFGFFGCNHDVQFPDRVSARGGGRFLKDLPPNGGFSFSLQGDQFGAVFFDLPVFVPELDSVFRFRTLSVGGSIDEPVVKGWKE
ncbi:hypothetical protein [Roseibium sp. MB-4]